MSLRHPILLLFYFSFNLLLLQSIEAQENEVKEKLPSETIDSSKLAITSEHVTKIDTKTIKQNPTNLADLLKNVSGFRINEQGGLGQFATALIRGSNSKQIKVFKNGIPLSSNRYGLVNLSSISTKNIKSIEIYKGYYPSYLASNSAGAIINLISDENDTEKPFQSNSNITYGSFETFLLHTSFEESNKKYFTNLSIDHTQSENNYKFLNDKGTPYNSQDDFLDKKKHNAYQESSMEHTFGQHTTIGQWSLHWLGKIGEQELGGPKNVSILKAKTEFAEFNTDINLKLKSENLWQYNSTFYTSIENKNFHDPLGEIGFAKDELNEKQITFGSKNYLSKEWGQNLFSNILLEPIMEQFIKYDKIRQQKQTWQRDILDFCLEQSFISTSKKWEVKINSFLEATTATSSHNLSNKKKERALNTIKASTRYTSDKELQLKLSLGQNARMPSLFELYGDNGLIVGNNLLKDEKYLFLELNFEKQWQIEKLKSYLYTGLTLYTKKGEDIINYQQISAGLARPFNIAETTIYGIELQTNWRNKYINWNNQLDYTEAKNTSANSYANKKILPGIPQYRFYSELTLKLKSLQFFYRCNMLSKEYFDEANLIEEKANLSQDIGLSCQYKKAEIKLEIKNIADVQREDFINYPLPGRSYWLQFNLTF